MFVLEIDRFHSGDLGDVGARKPRGRKGRAKVGMRDMREDKKLNGAIKAVKENTSAA